MAKKRYTVVPTGDKFNPTKIVEMSPFERASGSASHTSTVGKIVNGKYLRPEDKDFEEENRVKKSVPFHIH